MATTHHQKLLILDLDETLIHAREQRDGIDTDPDFSVFDYHVWKRPFLTDFIKQAQEWYDIAIWTASSPIYAQAVVPYLFAEPERLVLSGHVIGVHSISTQNITHYTGEKT